MKKRFLSKLFAIVMVAGLVPVMTIHSHAEDCTEHIYEKGLYIALESYHYAMCDVCGYWDGDNSGFHEDSNPADCICDVCDYSMHLFDELTDMGNGTHQGVCTVCDQTVDLPHVFDFCEWNAEVHWRFCDCGAVMEDSEKPHTFENNNWYFEDEYHYPECDVCGYHQPEGEPHDITDEDPTDKVCPGCTSCGHTEHSEAWDGKTWDSVDHWVVCSVCDNEDWQDHFDGDDEDQLCDGCGFNMACPHDQADTVYDNDIHWYPCRDCGQSVFNPEIHSFECQRYYAGSDKHYPVCDGCDYYKEPDGEDHVDENEDQACDICYYWIHEHIYEYEYWDNEDGKHYPVCDICDEPDRTLGEACTDANNDHGCDVCYVLMENLCIDTDGNHSCDVCDYTMMKLCADTDGNHVCDAEDCRRYMNELCSSAEDDWICDVCGENFCDHVFDNMPLSNHDGTHTSLCRYCGTVTEDCFPWHYDASQDTETTHTAICNCGYEVAKNEPHNFVLNSRRVTGHWLICDGCGYEKLEAHETQNGICTVCEMQVTAYDDVYVGGVGLKDGQYLDNSGNVADTQPEGGYAYYKGGVLELVDYYYQGEGFLWEEYVSGSCAAAIYATTDLILELKGVNELDMSEYVAGFDRDGIVTEKDLTVCGEGELTVLSDDDGIYLEKGDFTMESGTVYLGTQMYDEVGSLINNEVSDDGLDVNNGDALIKGGVLNIVSDDHGFDVEGTVTIHGGTVEVDADDDGFNIEYDIIITGGEVNVIADDYGFDSDSGSVIIVGGYVSIETDDWSGIFANKNAEIYGGEVKINAYDAGISGERVIIYGGSLEVAGDWTDIYAYELTLYVALPENAVLDEYESEVYLNADGILYLEGDHKCIDEYSKDHKCDNCSETMGDEHKVEEGEHLCGYCGEPVTPCEEDAPVRENEVEATFDRDGSYDMVVYCTLCGKEVSRTTYPIEKLVRGDINGDKTVNIVDVLALFRYIMLPTSYPITYTGTVDFNVDGAVDIADAIKLFRYSMLPGIYPL